MERSFRSEYSANTYIADTLLGRHTSTPSAPNPVALDAWRDVQGSRIGRLVFPLLGIAGLLCFAFALGMGR